MPLSVLGRLSLALSVLALCRPSSAFTLQTTGSSGNKFRPVVIWHGLGDVYNSPGIVATEKIITDTFEDIFVASVYLDEDPNTDQQRSIFGNVTEELQGVCEQLAELPELKGGFDSIGYSQGGLFLRAYAERCNDPPLKTLITFGSPHNGIADLPLCKPHDFLCRKRNDILRSQVWTSYAQRTVVTAQYFRDPADLDSYLEYSSFLADINNERSTKNATYADNLAQSLEKLVLIKFSYDETLVPRHSAWFQEYNRTTGQLTPFEKRPIYQDDWIGLKTLGESGGIEYLELAGQHMQFSDTDLQHVVERYLGNPNLGLIIQGL